MNHVVNWSLISSAIDFYQNNGYKYVETPWVVSEESVRVTYKGTTHLLELGSTNTLVGSAEQGFIQMMNNNDLKPGCYVTNGPCFRYESVRDILHQEYFMKVELIHILSSNSKITGSLNECISCAFEFFNKNTKGKLEYEETNEGIDIKLNSIEIGSYGFRSHKDHTWIYGTGLAEPRFSIANKM